MQAKEANKYTDKVMVILLRELKSKVKEMKMIVWVAQICATDRVEPNYVKTRQVT